MYTVTVVLSALCVASPAWLPAVPENVGVVEFVALFANAARVGLGATVSTSQV